MTSTLTRPAAPTEPVELTPVRDNANWAWRNRSAEVDAEIFASLPADLVHDYRAELDAMAVGAMEDTLVEVWSERGCALVPCSEEYLALPGERDQPDDIYFEVWDEAALRVDVAALVTADPTLAEEMRRYGDDSDYLTDRDY